MIVKNYQVNVNGSLPPRAEQACTARQGNGLRLLDPVLHFTCAETANGLLRLEGRRIPSG